MTLDLPKVGQTGWGQKLNDAVREAYESGQGRRDLSQTLALRATRRHGQVLAAGPSAFDAGYVESPCVILDPLSGRLAMLYAGYTVGQTAASHGLAFSDDGLNWVKWGQTLAGSGVAGDPDSGGVTGPVAVFDGGIFHLFYIGLDAAGYEAGTPRICHATSYTLQGPWTRHGAVISPSGAGWRASKVWHPNLVRRGSTWYLFFNATGADGLERCGFATAPSLDGPWIVEDNNSPILPIAGHETDGIWGGDPFIYREGDHWRMVFACAQVGATPGDDWVPVGDFSVTTTDANFPYGWSNPAQLTDYSQGEPFKPWMAEIHGETWHYGTGSGAITAVTPDRPTPALTFARVDFTGASQAVPSGAWGAVTGLGDLTIKAKVGDLVECGLSVLLNDGAGDFNADFASIVGGNRVHYWSGGDNGTDGVMGLFRRGGAYSGSAGTVIRPVTADDLEWGYLLTARALFRTWSTRGLQFSSTTPGTWWLRNLSA